MRDNSYAIIIKQFATLFLVGIIEKAAIHVALVLPFDMRNDPAYFRFFCQLKLHNNTLVMYRSCGCEGFSTAILLLTNWIFLHARVDNKGNSRKNSLKHMTDDDDGRWRAHRFFPASHCCQRSFQGLIQISLRTFIFVRFKALQTFHSRSTTSTTFFRLLSVICCERKEKILLLQT